MQTLYGKGIMGRKKDKFWEYVEKLPNERFKCLFCDRDFSGGASRIKLHMAGLKGHDIDICKKVPEDVKKKACLAIGGSNEILKRASTSSDVQESAIAGSNKKLKSASTSSDVKESAITSTSLSKIKEAKIVFQVFF